MSRPRTSLVLEQMLCPAYPIVNQVQYYHQGREEVEMKKLVDKFSKAIKDVPHDVKKYPGIAVMFIISL